MLVNLSDGSTVSFDLQKQTDLDAWETLRQDRMGDITGLSVARDGVLHSLPFRRKRFRRFLCDAELVRKANGRIVGERLVVHADDITATVLVYWSGHPPMVRYDLERTGRPVYLPRRS